MCPIHWCVYSELPHPHKQRKTRKIKGTGENERKEEGNL